MNPSSTDCDADALTITPSRRCTVFSSTRMSKHVITPWALMAKFFSKLLRSLGFRLESYAGYSRALITTPF